MSEHIADDPVIHWCRMVTACAQAGDDRGVAAAKYELARSLVPPKKGLTARQRQVLIFVGSFWSDNGFAPSYSEIQRGCGFNSRGHTFTVVQALIQRGWLAHRPGAQRSLRVLEGPADEPTTRPVGGRS